MKKLHYEQHAQAHNHYRIYNQAHQSDLSRVITLLFISFIIAFTIIIPFWR